MPAGTQWPFGSNSNQQQQEQQQEQQQQQQQLPKFVFDSQKFVKCVKGGQSVVVRGVHHPAPASRPRLASCVAAMKRVESSEARVIKLASSASPSGVSVSVSAAPAVQPSAPASTPAPAVDSNVRGPVALTTATHLPNYTGSRPSTDKGLGTTTVTVVTTLAPAPSALPPVVVQPASSTPQLLMASASSAATLSRVLTTGGSGPGGVSVYRENVTSNPGIHQSSTANVSLNAVASKPPPPAAHAPTSVTLNAPGATSQNMHVLHASTNQLKSNPAASNQTNLIKPETIALPTTPVNVQYTSNAPTNFAAANLTTAKSVSNQTANTSHPPNIVHVGGHQQLPAVIQQKSTVTYGPPTIRTIPATSLPTIPNPSVTAVSSIVTVPAPQHLKSASNVVTNSGPPSINQGSNAQFQRLKVEDALTYLDQVKFNFGNQPQVYNDFLDIMKEFKSQSIDTPGVIARVSCLFKGHPDLIVGFNTFLPPGYKIEVQQCNDGNASLNMPHGTIGSSSGMQTIVHTPQGIHTMSAHGHMAPQQPPAANAVIAQNTNNQVSQQKYHQSSVILSQQGPPTSLRPIPISTASQPTAKFGAILSNNGTAGIAQIKTETGVNLFPQQPAPSHVSSAGNQNSQAQLQQQQQQQQFQATTVAIGKQHQQPTITQNQQQPPIVHHPTTVSLGREQVNHAPQSYIAAAASLHINNSNPTAPSNNQPEFNHAINYVNKIKNRFQGQPDVYKQFLEILHTYQKHQQAVKEGVPYSGKHLSEGEVFAQVSKLFQNQKDLLSEFGQFLPEATGDQSNSNTIILGDRGLKKHGYKPFNGSTPAVSSTAAAVPHVGTGLPNLGIKRPAGSNQLQPSPKKPKFGILKDVSLAEAGKYGTLNEFAYFDRVRKALKDPDVYNNFIRCLILFNQEVISRQELVQLVSSFLSKHPELLRWFKDFVGFKDHLTNSLHDPGLQHSLQPGRERISGDSALEVDYSTCKRLGASYCALPKSFVQPSCSGRTVLCNSVLNDTWVSFPSWSEDSQFVTSRKTQYEEFVYRTEDERFEFDIVFEANRDTIKVLEAVQKKMSRMPPEEAARHRLDDCLGGTSATIHKRAVRRIYGDKATDIIDGLKRNPVVAVPLVLRRLKGKDEEWRDVQKNFNKVWRDQNEKYYLKSLDHQCLLFKQSDGRNLRSKGLLNEIETLFEDRHEELSESNNTSSPSLPSGPHITLQYQDRNILEDANNLLIHHVKRQTGIQKEDKHRIKVLLKHFLMDLFKHPRQELSDDEKTSVEVDEDKDDSSDKESNSRSSRSERARKRKDEKQETNATVANHSSSHGSENKSSSTMVKLDGEVNESNVKLEPLKDGRTSPLHARDVPEDETYRMMMCNNNWYLFLRLHNILCERLTKMYNQAVLIASEESRERKGRQAPAAVALKLKPKCEIDPEEYYPAFLDMVKSLLDCNMDSVAYEDTLREMFGIHAYISFTLDKVVINAVRQLQHLVTDEVCVECYDLYHHESQRGATGGPCATASNRALKELIYQKKSERILAEENCFKIFIYQLSMKVSIEMLDTDDTQDSDHEEHNEKWHRYVDRFLQPGDFVSDECKRQWVKNPIFLPRGIRSYGKSPFGKMRLSASCNKNNMKKADKNDVDQYQPVDCSTAVNVTKSSDDAKKSAEVKQSSSQLKASKNLGPVPLPPNGLFYHEDNLHCQFHPKNFQILYVVNSEAVFYRRKALLRAKQSHKRVSRHKFGAFERWHSSWLKSHSGESAERKCSDWFMGKTEGLVANKTSKVVRSDPEKPPYRTYTKFKVENKQATAT